MRNAKPLKLLLLLIMMLLLLPGMPVSASTENNGKIKIAAQGTKLIETAYIVPLKDGRDTLEQIDTQSAEISTLRGIVASKDVQIDKLILSVNDLNKNRLQERTEWQNQVKTIDNKYIKTEAALERERRKQWGIGAFGGVSQKGVVVGIGITLSFFRF